MFLDVNIDPPIHDFMPDLLDGFQMAHLGDVSYYLEMKVGVNLGKKTIIFWQSTYLKKLPERYGMSDYTPAKISISPWVGNFLIAYKNQDNKSSVT